MSSVKISLRNGEHFIEGAEITVPQLMKMLSVGMTPEAIADQFPPLTEEDIKACVEYALKNVQ